MTAPLTYSLEGTTAVVRMDDGKANALSNTMLDALLDALSRAEREASALVLAGRPDRFCAGFDLRIMMSGPDAATAMFRRGGELLLKLYATPLPLVIACTGHAIAGGALMVLTGDHRIGAAGAFKLGLNELAINLPVPLLAMELARDRLSPPALARATLGAQIFSPADAVTAGYLDETAPPDAVLPRALEHAARLGAFPRVAYSSTKRRLRGKMIDHVLANQDADMRTWLSP